MLLVSLMQVDEKTKTVCKPAGYAEALTADEAEVRRFEISCKYIESLWHLIRTARADYHSAKCRM